MLAATPFTEYEPGVCDVDMWSGRIGSHKLPDLCQMWYLSGHRVHCTMPEVQRWVQIAAGPMPIYAPIEFGSYGQLQDLRKRFVDALWMKGVLVFPYESDKETSTRPMTLIAGKLHWPGLDLGLLLRELGILEVELELQSCMTLTLVSVRVKFICFSGVVPVFDGCTDFDKGLGCWLRIKVAMHVCHQPVRRDCARGETYLEMGHWTDGSHGDPGHTIVRV